MRLCRLLVALLIIASNVPTVRAAIENPGVDILTVPTATQFSMPFGDRSASPAALLRIASFNGFLTKRFDLSFKHISLTPDKECGDESSEESTGWYVYTPFNSDKTYDGKAYSSSGSFHPGEDWNGQSGGSDELCQPVYPIAEGVILAKGFDQGFGNTLFVLHRLGSGEFFVSVYAHLYDVPDIPVGTIVQRDKQVGRVDTTGTVSSHLHWEIRRSSFLETIGSLVRLHDSGDFRPNTWPATGRADHGKAFIGSHYCDPSQFVKHGVNPGPQCNILPTAGFTMTTEGLPTKTNGQTLTVTVAVGGTALVDISAIDCSPGPATGCSFDPDGRIFSRAWTLDSTPVSALGDTLLLELTSGTHTVTLVVTDDKGAQSAQVSGTIVVSTSPEANPEVAVSPPSGPAGTVFSYTGQGFSANATATSHLKRPDGTEFATLQISTSSTGTFSASIDSSGFAPGTYEVWAVDNNTTKSSPHVTFSVTGGAGGSLDLSFGTGGKVATDLGPGTPGIPDGLGGSDGALAVTLQPDRKILVAGTFGGVIAATSGFVARYSPDGFLDLAFGTAGKVVTDFGPTGVAVQPDGRILAGGTFGDLSFRVARFNPDGTLDRTFGTDGRVVTEFGAGYFNPNAEAMALQLDGKILLAGWVQRLPSSAAAFAIVRYNSDGSLDSTFGSGGILATDLGFPCSAIGTSVASQVDGKIVVAGYTYPQCSPATGFVGYADFVVARFNLNGALDTAFGAAGVVVTDFQGFNDYASDIALQADGKIIIAGRAHLGDTNGNRVGIVRYNLNGTLDPSFGIGGKVATPFGNVDGEVKIRIQLDGKIVATGPVNSDGSVFGPDFGLARYNPDGTLDPSFGTGGKVVTDFQSPGYAYARALAIQADGRIVVVGTATIGLQYDTALVRFLGQ